MKSTIKQLAEQAAQVAYDSAMDGGNVLDAFDLICEEFYQNSFNYQELEQSLKQLAQQVMTTGKEQWMQQAVSKIEASLTASCRSTAKKAKAGWLEGLSPEDLV